MMIKIYERPGISQATQVKFVAQLPINLMEADSINAFSHS
tara:strand:+ start:266 stop:385 length:120 start_codon:yes stop_codon:yes gene_type:complete